MGELLVSFAVAMTVAPLVMRVMRSRSILDIPNQRSSHLAPVPRGGGIACLIGVLAGLAFASARHQDVPWLAISGALFLAVVGFADDNLAIAAAPRLAAQMAVGALVGVTVGGGWWIAVGLIGIPVAVNAVNFMDGINGITSLNLAFWGLVAIAVGYAQNEPSLQLIGAVTTGSTMAFLPWNAPVARLFLGDVGSYLLGALVGVGVVIGAHQTPSVVVLLAPLSIYLADTGTTLVRRALRGERLTSAHKQHVYQRLVSESGMSHSTVAIVTVALGLVITLAWVQSPPLVGPLVTLLILAAYLASPTALSRTVKSRHPHVKRGFDLVVSGVMLLVTCPVLMALAVVVRLDSRGPAFFRQERVGLGGETFRIHKFRSMCVKHGGELISATGDARVTSVGGVMRRTKLDELPQMLDVFLGHMSLVGPRPEVPIYVEMWPADVRQVILSVRPGITDPASIAFRNESDELAAAEDPGRHYVEALLPRKAAMYVDYVNNRSFLGDLAVIGHTLVSVVKY